jgi:hypothetical protein
MERETTNRLEDVQEEALRIRTELEAERFRGFVADYLERVSVEDGATEDFTQQIHRED